MSGEKQRNKVFVRQLPHVVTKDEVRCAFKEHGVEDIVDVHVKRNGTVAEHTSAVSFVEFGSEESARLALLCNGQWSHVLGQMLSINPCYRKNVQVVPHPPAGEPPAELLRGHGWEDCPDWDSTPWSSSHAASSTGWNPWEATTSWNPWSPFWVLIYLLLSACPLAIPETMQDLS